MRCPPCGHDNPPGAGLCSACGATLTVRCAHCYVELPATAKFCLECGAPTAHAGKDHEARAIRAGTLPEPTAGTVAPEGEWRQLTVLFCDLVGSTSLSQELDAEDWRDVVTQYEQAATGAVTRFGGHVAKYLGDGLLVYFGWPTAREGDPERAIRAGLAILDTMESLNVKLAAGSDTRLAVRIGMHTGPVVIASGGEVFGETPNIAARVQAAAKPDTVVITAATQRLVAGMFVVEDCGPQVLKGIREPVVLYRAVEASGMRSRLDIAAGRLTPFVGRDSEVATLAERWERSAKGEGQTVLIVGEAGVGKSRLAYELRERLVTVPHTWLECGATPYTESTPFHPVISLVSQAITVTSEDSDAEKLDKIRFGLQLAHLASSEAVALIADFLGLAPPTPLTMAPDVQRRKTIDLLAVWNLTMSQRQPIVVFVEDLHWCDPSSLELLRHLVTQGAKARVLLLGTTRPEFIPRWPVRSNVSTVQLARLAEPDACTMVVTLGGGALSEEMVKTLVARADGMPLYVEELTKAVVEPGVARSVEAIPPTLADSLMARLDRLSAAKEIAQQAAVLGREFPYALLAAVSGMEEAALCHGLARLVDAGIVHVRGEPPNAIYTFKHALVQEAAYGSLLKRVRQQLHGRVVDVLRERFPERAAAEPEVVARHAEAAGRIDDAITYYTFTGELAEARWAHEEAIGHLQKAIALLETRPASAERDERELAMLLALGPSLVAGRGYSHSETGAVWERAVALAETAGDATRLGKARFGLAIFYFLGGGIEPASTLFTALLTLARLRDDRPQEIGCHQSLAGIDYLRGNFVSSLAHADRARSLYDPVHQSELVRLTGDVGVMFLAYAAWSLWALGHPDAALARAQEGVALARRLEHPFSVAAALSTESVVHWIRRDLAAQRECAAHVIALSQSQGFPLWLGVGRAFHAVTLVMEGDQDALAEVVEGLALAAETGNQAAGPALVMLAADAERAAGELIAAQGAVATGLAVAARTGQPFWDAELHRLDGDILLATGAAVDEVAARYRRALGIARKQGARSFELRAATSLARLWRDQGKLAEARDLLAPVYAWFTEGFDTGDLRAAKSLLAELA